LPVGASAILALLFHRGGALILLRIASNNLLNEIGKLLMKRLQRLLLWVLCHKLVILLLNHLLVEKLLLLIRELMLRLMQLLLYLLLLQQLLLVLMMLLLLYLGLMLL
jgi:hypothetical protein